MTFGLSWFFHPPHNSKSNIKRNHRSQSRRTPCDGTQTGTLHVHGIDVLRQKGCSLRISGLSHRHRQADSDQNPLGNLRWTVDSLILGYHLEVIVLDNWHESLNPWVSKPSVGRCEAAHANCQVQIRLREPFKNKEKREMNWKVTKPRNHTQKASSQTAKDMGLSENGVW